LGISPHEIGEKKTKLQENESGNCSIWNKCYIKDVYLNK
jgi:hypothetical protein